ncbi:hypothetical protein T492DRAFT_1012121 [Pavlovales sp. CCMP2436]|nr:hypothetical protein T492DRAFT_1012121 [Pavlovales sp. CCMP2436]|mmetsp:Transcript_29542/g.74247  ORF Transcript_29542/g.74247 Transcript_29542/m.74247 type:complete len:358 (-) Transcript_29542:37-1110(-)
MAFLSALLLSGVPSAAALARPLARAAPRARAMLSTAARPPLHLYTAERCVLHDAGGGHPESPERLASLLRLARGEWTADFGASLVVLEPEVEATDEHLTRVHTPRMVAGLRSAFAAAVSRQATLSLDADTRVNPSSGPAALRAAGLVVAAVDEVLSPASATKRAFVMARPPGHHAEPDMPMGFCLFNSICVGLAHAQAVHGVKRVALLDFDVHHGNGGQAICTADPSRFFASSHQSPCYPGTANKQGRFGVAEQVIIAPLKPGAGSAPFRAAWADQILPALREFGPEMIFVSAGFDAHEADELASLNLHEEDFEWVTRAIIEAAGPSVPVVSYLEGGYNIPALGASVRAHVKAMIEA